MYDGPYDWLLHYVEEIYDEAELRWFIQQLASKLDPDQIQDLFQDIMIEDGYFDDEDAADDDEEEDDDYWPDEDDYLDGGEEES